MTLEEFAEKMREAFPAGSLLRFKHQIDVRETTERFLYSQLLCPEGEINFNDIRHLRGAIGYVSWNIESSSFSFFDELDDEEPNPSGDVCLILETRSLANLHSRSEYLVFARVLSGKGRVFWFIVMHQRTLEPFNAANPQLYTVQHFP